KMPARKARPIAAGKGMKWSSADLATNWEAKPTTAKMVRKMTRSTRIGTLPTWSQPRASAAKPSGWSATVSPCQCNALAPISSPKTSVTARAIIRLAAKENGQSSGAKNELTAELPSVGLCSFQGSETLIDPVLSGKLLEFSQLGRVGVNCRSYPSDASLARQDAVEG